MSVMNGFGWIQKCPGWMRLVSTHECNKNVFHFCIDRNSRKSKYMVLYCCYDQFLLYSHICCSLTVLGFMGLTAPNSHINYRERIVRVSH